MGDSNITLRPLTIDDLEQVVELDRAIGQVSRRGFFDKRLEAQQRDPESFLSLAAVDDGRIVGIALAHLLDGEFGGSATVAVLDALSVRRDHQSSGIGHALMDALCAAARGRGAEEMQTQAGWDEPALLGFFSAVGFSLAPRLVLERAASLTDY